mmetsp:Transcript_30510/g.45443  ORF Transcript_30510/g.45443 Transcript_30510/m.45443 type:complete len:226 (-) Transcript_30510:132-809(-)
MPITEKQSGKEIKNVFVLDCWSATPLGIPAKGELNKHYSKAYINFFESNGATVTSTFLRDVEGNCSEMDHTAECKKWKEADLVIIQSPMWWFSLPWKAKAYLDYVLTVGMDPKGEYCLSPTDGRHRVSPEDDYATGGLCKGVYMASITTNAPNGAYCRDVNPGELKGRSLDEMILGIIHGNMQFIGLKKIPDSTFHVADVVKNHKFEQDQERFQKHLNSMFVTSE